MGELQGGAVRELAPKRRISLCHALFFEYCCDCWEMVEFLM